MAAERRAAARREAGNSFTNSNWRCILNIARTNFLPRPAKRGEAGRQPRRLRRILSKLLKNRKNIGSNHTLKENFSNHHMKTVGIIGGLGPETTAEFYLELSFGCYQKNKDRRPGILIWNIPQSYKIEEEVQTETKGEERYIPYLTKAAKMLEKAGADFLVMPCNTLHIFIEDIRRSVKIPVLSIVEETIKFLKDKKISRVGILAMPGAIKHKLYGNALKKEGIEQVLPTDFDQAKIGKIVNSIVLSRQNNRDRKELLKIIDMFGKNGVKDVILACTDLQLLILYHPKLRIYDTMKIFADATIQEILRD